MDGDLKRSYEVLRSQAKTLLLCWLRLTWLPTLCMAARLLPS